MKLTILIVLVLAISTASAFDAELSADKKTITAGEFSVTSSTPSYQIKSNAWGYEKAGEDVVASSKELEVVDNDYICEQGTRKKTLLWIGGVQVYAHENDKCIHYKKQLVPSKSNVEQNPTELRQISKLSNTSFKVSYEDDYDPEYVNYTGSCDSTCYIETSAYNATLQEGVITSFVYFALDEFQWADDGNDIGSIYSTSSSWVMNRGISTTNCTVSENLNNVQIHCTAPKAQNKWTFYEEYIKLESYANENYRVYTYVSTPDNGDDNGYIWNGSTKDQALAFNGGHGNSEIGVSGISHADATTPYMYVHVWDETIVTNFDYGNSTDNWAGVAIGRQTAISPSNWLTQYIRIIERNDSASGDERYIDALIAFKEDPSLTPTISGGNDIVFEDGKATFTELGVGTESTPFEHTQSYGFPPTFSNAAADFSYMIQSSGTNVLGFAAQTADPVSYIVTNNGYELGLAVSGVERVRIDTSGRVGIGTELPQKQLDVAGETQTQNRMTIKGTNPRLDLNSDSLDETWYLQQLDASGDFRIYQQDGVGEVLRIQNETGKIGIGTSTPNARFEIETTSSEHGLLSTQSSNQYAGVFQNSQGSNLVYLAKGEDSTDERTLYVYRDRSATDTDSPVAEIKQYNGADDQPALVVDQNGDGNGIYIDSEAANEYPLLVEGSASGSYISAYFSHNISAGGYIDRTPFPEKGYDALTDIKKIEADEHNELDHSTLPKYAYVEFEHPIYETHVEEHVRQEKNCTNESSCIITDYVEQVEVREKTGTETQEGRDLGAMTSIHTVAIQQLIEIIEDQEERIKELEKLVGTSP